MNETGNELLEVAKQLDEAIQKFKSNGLDKIFKIIEENIKRYEDSFSESWIGYHSRVYYRDFQHPPSGDRFSQEWGLNGGYFIDGTTGDWIEYKYDDVVEKIYGSDRTLNLEKARKTSKEAKELFEDKKEEFSSITARYLQGHHDTFIEKQRTKVDEMRVLSQSDFVEYYSPKGKFFTRDSIALSQGMKVPPHIAVKCEIFSLMNPLNCLVDLEKHSRRAGSHLVKQGRKYKKEQEIGTNVFIGHGRSLVWKELKDFIQDRLKLPWDEFNRVPVAGVTNISRLSDMLEDAAFAFIIMTAEDEKADGKISARLNVIHEAGLFQGHLGFTKAIILLEEGCEEFSNIEGLGQIRFPKGNIKVALEEVRQVLERENLL